jgi:hypothetical protein
MKHGNIYIDKCFREKSERIYLEILSVIMKYGDFRCDLMVLGSVGSYNSLEDQFDVYLHAGSLEAC